MELPKVCSRILSQLADVMRQLEPSDFARPSAALSRATIGQHVRHTLEFFICLENGIASGVVNYDNREHNECMESSKELAQATLERVIQFVADKRTNLPLTLEMGYDRNSEATEKVESNYLRELAYNIEHAVHHMAMIKVGLWDLAPYVKVPSDFGVAASTVRHQNMLLADR